VAVALLALCATAGAASAAPGELPPQGVYEACGPAESGQTCLDRLGDTRAGGFRLVLNYRLWVGERGRPAPLRRHRRPARNEDHHVIGLVRNLPATWGYYVGDEVPEYQRPQAAAFAQLVKALDPSHPRLFVAVEGPGSAGANLEPFA
jgi:hypothetical protein